MKMSKTIRKEYNIQNDTQAMLLEALDEGNDITCYQSDDDEIGDRGCCGALSYQAHADDCWVVRGVRLLQDQGVIIPSHLLASINNSE